MTKEQIVQAYVGAQDHASVVLIPAWMEPIARKLFEGRIVKKKSPPPPKRKPAKKPVPITIHKGKGVKMADKKTVPGTEPKNPKHPEEEGEKKPITDTDVPPGEDAPIEPTDRHPMPEEDM